MWLDLTIFGERFSVIGMQIDIIPFKIYLFKSV